MGIVFDVEIWGVCVFRGTVTMACSISMMAESLAFTESWVQSEKLMISVPRERGQRIPGVCWPGNLAKSASPKDSERLSQKMRKRDRERERQRERQRQTERQRDRENECGRLQTKILEIALWPPWESNCTYTQ